MSTNRSRSQYTKIKSDIFYWEAKNLTFDTNILSFFSVFSSINQFFFALRAAARSHHFPSSRNRLEYFPFTVRSSVESRAHRLQIVNIPTHMRMYTKYL